MDEASRGPNASASEETATTGATGQPPDEGGLGGQPIRPSERTTYGTDQVSDVETADAPASSPPGVVIGLVLLGVFVAILVWAVVTAVR
jgi:hypothetical protein